MSNKIYAKARFAYNNKPKSWWEENNPILENGEPGIVSDVDEGEWFKIGDGKTHWNNLPWKNKKTADQAYDPESENAQSGKAVAQAVANKQDILISGKNVKTINGQSILGSGDITIEGGSGNVENPIPDYWEEHLTEKINKIKELQRAGGKDCYSFVVITDFHLGTDPRDTTIFSNNLHSPKMIKKIMDECSIKFCLCLGDMQAGGANWFDKELTLEEWNTINNLFEPISNRTLMIPGNHDGSYGKADLDGDGTTDHYIYNLTPEEIYDVIYRKVSLIDGVKFSRKCNGGYYVDDTVHKVRYIMLNTFCNEYASNEDGSVVNNNMRKSRLTQDQHDMVIEALQSITSDDWNVVVCSHMPICTVGSDGGGGDLSLLRDVLEAYQNKSNFSGVYNDKGNLTELDYDYVSVNVDFSNAKGKVIGAFAGHMHNDIINKNYAFPIIVSHCDNVNSYKNVTGGTITEIGTKGTITEHSFNVFTVDKRKDIIYRTKIGLGIDGEVSIGETYAITINMSDGAKVSNNDTFVAKNNAYNNVITVDNGYSLQSVTVIMNGVDITETAYSNGVISIEQVTGDIVITLVADLLYHNLVDLTSEDCKIDIGFLDDSTGELKSDSTYNKGVIVTNFIPVGIEDILRFKGLDAETAFGGEHPYIVGYDENFNRIVCIRLEPAYYDKNNGLSYTTGAENGNAVTITDDGVYAYKILIQGNTGTQFVTNDVCNLIRYVRLSAKYLTSPEDVIVTVNEEIV